MKTFLLMLHTFQFRWPDGADRNPCFLYSVSRELVSKSIICPSVLQASGRFSQPQTVGKLLPGPLLRKASRFCSRGVRGSRKLIALSLLSRMKDSGKRRGVINRTLLHSAARRTASSAVSFVRLIITWQLVSVLLKYQHGQIIHFHTFTGSKNSSV